MFYFHYLRVRYGLTQMQLHDLTGINQAHIGLMELGRLIPTPGQREALAEALKVTEDVVMLRVTINPPVPEAKAEPVAS